MMIQLQWHTPLAWAQHAIQDFDAFLLDHAACERKASAVGMSFVVRYPDREEMLEPMIQFAREELEHFHQVFRVIQSRGIQLVPDEPDTYVNQLMKLARNGREEHFLDRLLISGVIEARGTERMKLIAQVLEDEKLKIFYERLARTEDRHKDFFITLAHIYFDEATIQTRLETLIAEEASIASQLPYRCALH